MNVPIIRFVFDRRHTACDTRKGTVDMVITFDKQRKYLSTGVKCYPHQWKDNPKKNIYVSGTGADVEINKILHTMYQKTFKILSEQIEKGQVDISAITEQSKAQSVDKSFLQYIIERMDKRDVSDYTYRAYTSFYNKLSEYGKMKYFSDISEKSIRDFDEWLHKYSWDEIDRYGKKVRKKYSQATIGSMHKNLKAFINDAVIDGYLKTNPYSAKRIKIDKGVTRIDKFLTKDEIERIEDSDMPTKSLSEARDLFLIQINTGISYGDLMIYDFTKCRDAEDYSVFSGYRHKTGVLFTFVLTPTAKRILEKYDYRLPKIPNQKYNVKLKMVADAAGIDKAISSHDGRRSCGYKLLNAGVPISVVSRILGHSSIKQTESAYARLLDKTIADEVKKHLK